MGFQTTNEKLNLNIESIYNISKEILLNGCKKLKYYNFISNIGGINDGTYEIIINVLNSCNYYLIIKYVTYEKNLSFKISINNVEDYKIYYANFLSQWSINTPLTITIPIILNKGFNNIKFYGNKNNNAPYIGQILIILPPLTNGLKKEDIKIFTFSIFLNKRSILSFEGPTNGNAPFLGAFTITEKKLSLNKPYKINLITFYNGAKKFKEEDFVTLIGGPKNGGVSLIIETLKGGVYDLSFKYICEVNGRVLCVNINENTYINQYIVPTTNDWEIINAKTFTIPLNLKDGINKVNIEGNGHNFHLL